MNNSAKYSFVKRDVSISIPIVLHFHHQTFFQLVCFYWFFFFSFLNFRCDVLNQHFLWESFLFRVFPKFIEFFSSSPIHWHWDWTGKKSAFHFFQPEKLHVRKWKNWDKMLVQHIQRRAWGKVHDPLKPHPVEHFCISITSLSAFFVSLSGEKNVSDE